MLLFPILFFFLVLVSEVIGRYYSGGARMYGQPQEFVYFDDFEALVSARHNETVIIPKSFSSLEATRTDPSQTFVTPVPTSVTATTTVTTSVADNKEHSGYSELIGSIIIGDSRGTPDLSFFAKFPAKYKGKISAALLRHRGLLSKWANSWSGPTLLWVEPQNITKPIITESLVEALSTRVAGSKYYSSIIYSDTATGGHRSVTSFGFGFYEFPDACRNPNDFKQLRYDMVDCREWSKEGCSCSYPKIKRGYRFMLNGGMKCCYWASSEGKYCIPRIRYHSIDVNISRRELDEKE